MLTSIEEQDRILCTYQFYLLPETLEKSYFVVDECGDHLNLFVEHLSEFIPSCISALTNVTNSNASTYQESSIEENSVGEDSFDSDDLSRTSILIFGRSSPVPNLVFNCWKAPFLIP
jgi:hypothetical protein